jgi:hypothetical protein
MTDDNIESIWRQTMRSSADNAPMAFARALVAFERDCRTCAHYRAGVMHCTAPLRCVAGSSYCKAGRVQQWEAAPVDAGF